MGQTHSKPILDMKAAIIANQTQLMSPAGPKNNAFSFNNIASNPVTSRKHIPTGSVIIQTYSGEGSAAGF